jgi:outer membrane protein TolC
MRCLFSRRPPWLLASLLACASATAAPTANVASARVAAADTLTFRDALARVLARDPQVRQSREQLAVLQAQGRQARSRLFPKVGVSATNGRADEVESGIPVRRSTDRSEATLRWNLFNGLADQAQIDSLEQERTAAEADLQRTLDETAERLADAYFDLQRLQRLERRSTQRLSEVLALGAKVERQSQLGKGSEADGQLAASTVIDARVTHQLLMAELQAARIKLQTLLGQPVPALADDDGPLAASTDVDSPEGNAQWRAARIRAEAARTRLGPMSPDLLPRVDLDVRKGLSDRTRPALSTTDKNSWTVTISYEVPLGGEAGARRDEGLHRAEAASADAQRIAQALYTDFGATQARLAQSDGAAPLLSQQVQHLDVVVRASELQYEAGRRTLMQLIELRDNRFAVEQRLEDNRMKRITGRLHLRSLAGGLVQALGWTEPAPAQ